jgi:fructokinase
MAELFDVTALGELLIDFTPAGISTAGNPLFERNPGGAPANVAAAVSKLGGKSAFIGKVGNDQFGIYLKKVLDDNKINTDGLKLTGSAYTTLAFVHLEENGERLFSFYRRGAADTKLSAADLELGIIEGTRIFHFGSLSLTNEPARSATVLAAEHAKNSGRLISYDPNWRPPLWKSEKAARKGMSIGLKYADVLKISETELEFITGEKDMDRESRLLSDMGIKLVLVTLGPGGCYYRFNKGSGHLNTYDTRIVDTTGAGDAFAGAMLYCLSRPGNSLSDISGQQLEDMIDFSNAAGAICASRRGAIPAMASLEEIENCRRTIPRKII